MECPTCKQENPTGARFCMHCAAALVPACANCGAELPAGARFCPQCAHPVNAAAPAARAAEDRNPRAYTPKHLADAAPWPARGWMTGWWEYAAADPDHDLGAIDFR